MELEIRRLTPELAEDYVRFFDVTPHDDLNEENKCYCICWCSEDSDGQDFSTREKRRETAFRYAREGILQGYLAYHEGKPVGWCNANVKADCLKCWSWRMFMRDVPTDDQDRIKSVFCFVVAPEMQRKSVASRLLERVCQDAAREGFDSVEAYPNRTFVSAAADFAGPMELYRRNGFVPCGEFGDRLIVRKALK